MPPPTLAEPYPLTALSTYPALSYELLPPRTPAAGESLWRTIRALEATRPDYVSVTYGAGGSNHGTALELLERLQAETMLRPLAHLTCIGNSRAQLAGTIQTLINVGVRGILALRGDLPADGAGRGELRHALDLVELIRHVEQRLSARLAAGKLAVGVAAYASRHPESASSGQDLEVLLAKQAAGADFAITQVFFRARDYADLVVRAREAGVTIPLIPGIMPLTTLRRLDRLSELAGIPVDPAVRDRLTSAPDDAARRRIGVRLTVDLARAAFDAGAPGLHLYTFNEHGPALDVLESLQLPRPSLKES